MHRHGAAVYSHLPSAHPPPVSGERSSAP